MRKLVFVFILFTASPSSLANDWQWDRCWYGQQWSKQECTGVPEPISAFSARQQQAQHDWRLPTTAELKGLLTSARFTELRAHALELGHKEILSSEFISHGHEFLAATVNLETGKVTLQPWRQEFLLIWIKKP